MSKTIQIKPIKKGFKVVNVKAVSNENYLIIDESGKPFNKLKFIQQDKNLEIYLDVDGKEQQIAVLENYYEPNMHVSVVGVDASGQEVGYVTNNADGWSYVNGGMHETELGVTLPLIGLGVAGVGIAIASSGKSSKSDTNPSSQSDTKISGTITAGPVLQTNELKVNLYKADGTLLVENIDVNNDGTFSTTVSNYSGVVIAKVVLDADTLADYMDEATKQGIDLTAIFMAVGVITTGVELTFNINPLTTIAAYKAGVVINPNPVINATITDVINTNSAIGKAYGITDITTSPIVTSIKADGTAQTPNSYGIVLAALSGLDKTNSGNINQTISDMKTNTNISGSSGSLTSTGQAKIIDGAKNSGVTQSDISKLIDAIDPTAAQKATDLGNNLSTKDMSNVSPFVISKLTPAQISTLSDAQLSELTPAQVGALTTAQLAALTQAQIAALGNDISALTPAQLAALSDAQLGGLTPAQITALAADGDLANLSATQIAALGNDISALTPAQLAALTDAQLGGLTPAQITALAADGDLANLSATQIAALGNDISALTPAQLAALTDAQLGGLTPAQITALAADGDLVNLSATQIAALGNDISALTPAQLAALTDAQLGGLTPAQITALAADGDLANLSATQIAALGNDISALTPAQLAALTDAQLGGLTPAQITALAADGDLVNLSATQIAALGNDISALTPAQLAALTDAQLGGLTPAQITALAADGDLVNLSATQIAALGNDISALTPAQLAALTDAQLGGLTPAQITALAADGDLVNLSATQIAALGNDISALTPAQLAALSDAQLGGLTPTQITAMETIGNLDNLSADQISKLAPATLAALSDATMNTLATAGKLDNLTNAQVLGLTSTTIDRVPSSVMDNLSDTEVAALSDAQLGGLTPTQITAMETIGNLDNLSADQISKLAPATLAALSDATMNTLATAGKLDNLTNAQVLGLTSTTIDRVPSSVMDNLSDADVAALSDAQLGALTPTQITAMETIGNLDNLSADQISKLAPATLAALSDATMNTLATAGKLDNLTNAQVLGLTSTTIDRVPSSVMDNLSDTEVAALSDAQLGGLTPTQITAMETIGNLDNLSADQISKLAPATLAALSDATMNTLATAGKLDNLTNAQVLGLTSTTIDRVPSSVMDNLSDSDLGNLTSAQVAALTSAQIDNLSATQIAALGTDLSSLNSTAMGSIDSTQAAGITDTQLDTFDTTDIQALAPAAIGGLTPSALASLSDTQLGDLTSSQIVGITDIQLDNLLPAQITALGTDIIGLTPDKVAILSDEQLSALTPEQVQALLNDGDLVSLNSTQIALLGFDFSNATNAEVIALDPIFIPLVPSSVMDNLSDTEVAALSDAQLGGLTPTQITAMETIGNLDNLSADQISKLAPATLAALSDATMNTLATAGKLDNLTNAQVLGLTSTTIDRVPSSVMDNLSDTEVAALSDAQLGGLTPTQITAMETIGNLDNLSADQISKLAPATLAALSDATMNTLATAGKLDNLTNAQVLGLTSTTIDRVPSSVMDNLSDTEVAALSDAQLGGLTPTQITAMETIGNLDNLSADQISKLAPATLAALSDATMNTLATAGKLDNLTNAQVLGLTSTTIDRVPSSVMDNLSDTEVAALSDAQLGGLTPTQITAMETIGNLDNLSADQISKLAPATLAALSDATMNTLATAGKLDNLTNAQVVALPATTIDRVPSSVMDNLSDADVAALSDAQLGALTPTQITAMETIGNLDNLSADQISKLAPATLAALSDATMNTLATAGKLDNLTNAQVVALPATTIDRVPSSVMDNLSDSDLGNLTSAQVAALTSAQIDNLSATQIAALGTDLSSLNSTAMGSIDSTQAAGITNTQLDTFDTTDIQALAPAAIGGLTPSALASLSDTQLGDLTSAQVAALTSAQLTVLATSNRLDNLPSTLSTAQFNALASNGGSIIGHTEAFATVVVKNASDTVLGTTTADASGSFTILLSGLVQGDTIKAYAIDSAGNTSTVSTTTVVDPSIQVLSLSNDTGVLGDFITNVASQTISGKVVGTFTNGSDKVQVSLDGTTWLGATVTSVSATEYNWSISGATLINGTHNISVRVVNSSDVQLGSTCTKEYQLDAAFPEVSTVVITSNAGSDHYYVSGDSVEVTLTFNKNIILDTTNGSPSITINVGGVDKVATYSSKTSNSIKFTYQIVTGDNDINGISLAANSISLNGATIKDSAGSNANINHLLVSDDANNMVDTLAPSLTILSDKSALKAGETATITFTFSEAPIGFIESDIVSSNGVISALTVTADPKVYTAIFTPTASLANGNASITVASSSYTDAASNNGTAGTTPSITIDTLAPSLTILSDKSALKAGETATITFTFSEAPIGFIESDIVSSNGVISALSVTADPKVYTAIFTPTASLANGNASITVASSSYTDAASNNGTAGTTPSITIDTLAPSLTILSDKSALKAGETATITFTFSEAPIGFIESDIVSSNGVISALSVTADPKVYTAIFTPTASLANGNASITVASSSYTDAASNDGTAGTTPSITIDTIVPTVTISGVDSSNVAKATALEAGDKIKVVLSISEAVTVSGTPTYTIDVGGVSKIATYDVASSTSTSLVFYYTIANGDNDSTGGITATTTALTGGTIADSVGNSIVTTPVVNSGENTIAVSTVSFDVLKAYADGGATAPTATDYSNAGISGLTASQVTTINSYLATTAIVGTNVDSTSEIQALVDAVNKITALADGGTASGTALTTADITALGLSSVIGDSNATRATSELNLFNQVLDKLSASSVDTADKVANIASIVDRIMTTAAGGTASPALTATDFATIGITGVSSSNLASVITAIVNTADDGTGVDTLGEIQGNISLLSSFSMNMVPASTLTGTKINLYGISGANSDTAPAIIATADGGYIVTWQGNTPTNATEIFIQKYNSSNTAVGTMKELYGVSGANNDTVPQIIATADGGYVVIWQGATATNGTDIFIQRYDSSNNAVGTMKTLYGASGNYADTVPQITETSDGGYVVTWQGATAANGTNIFVQKYDSSNNAVGTVKELYGVSGNRADTVPVIKATADGGYVVIWQGATATNGTDIFIQKYDSSNNAVGTIKTLYAEFGSQADTVPQITATADGGYIVTWQGATASNGIDIFIQKYDSSNNAVGAMQEIYGTSGATSGDIEPEIIATKDGGYIVTWYGYVSAGAYYDIYVQRFDSSNNAVGTVKQMGVTTATKFDINPEITETSDGGCVVTWQGENTTSVYDIYVQKFDSLNNAVGAKQRLTSSNNNTVPQITATADGGYVVTWQGTTTTNGTDIFIQKYDAGGVPYGATGTANFNITTILDTTGYTDVSYQVVYTSGSLTIAGTSYASGATVTKAVWDAAVSGNTVLLSGASVTNYSFTLNATLTAADSSTVNVSKTQHGLGVSSPIMLDLNNDGVHTTSLADSSVVFDNDDNGTAEHMAWSDGKDGFLVLDLNKDGIINSGAELFGSGTTLANGTKAKDGYEALKQYDENKDNVIDVNDSIFAKLQIWIDKNVDGITSNDELKTLQELEIKSLNLITDGSSKVDNGNLLNLVSNYTKIDGTTNEMVDAWFATQKVQDSLTTLDKVAPIITTYVAPVVTEEEKTQTTTF